MPTEGQALRNRVLAAKRPDPLTPLIDRYLVERKHQPKPWTPPQDYPRPPGRFSPSNMECLRAGVFNFMGVPGKRKITPELQLIFDVGDWLHWMWFSNFLGMQDHFGPEVFRVVSIETGAQVPELWMAGRFDIHVEIRGRGYIIDIKTINDSGFSTRINTRQPDLGHSNQLTRYLRARRIKRGLIFYFNKNDQRYKVFAVPYSREHWMESVRWLKRGQDHMNQGIVPPMHPNCTKDSRMARNCPFAYLCYATRNPDKLKEITYAGKAPAKDLWEVNNSVGIPGRASKA